jgi:hypothetical protein
MIETILKIVAGVAALGIVVLVLVAVVSGLRSSVKGLGNDRGQNDTTDVE